jgi:hypothetical protein
MSDEMIYRDGVGYIPYHAHVRLMVVKDEQLATLRAEVLEEAAKVADVYGPLSAAAIRALKG